jgi:hypothetical protein
MAVLDLLVNNFLWIDNRSRLSNKDVRRLATFVSREFKEYFSKKIFLTIKDQTTHWNMGGRAYDRDHRNKPKGCKYRVFVGIGDVYYPYKNCYKERAGPVTYKTWDEEFVHVLSHELQHTFQFEWRYVSVSIEVDAELKAHEVLRKYRKHKSTKGLKFRKVEHVNKKRAKAI